LHHIDHDIDHHVNHNEIKKSQLDYVYEQSVVAATGYLLAVFVTAYLGWVAVDGVTSMIWLISVMGCSFLNVLFYSVLRKYDIPQKSEITLCILCTSISLILLGAVWSVAALVFMGSAVSLISITIITIIVVMVSGAMPLIGAVWLYFVAFSISSMAGLIWQYVEFGYVGVALVFVGFLIAMNVAAYKYSRIITRAICIDQRNLELVTEVQLSKNATEKAYVERSSFLAAASHDLRQPFNADVSVESEIDVGSTFTLRCNLGEKRAGRCFEDVALNTNASSMDLTVLLVDDEPTVRYALELILENWGCKILSANSMSAALDQVSSDSNIDIIVSDYRLKAGETGIDLIKKVQEVVGRRVPSLLVSGDTNPQLVREIRAQHYFLLHKPVKPAHLQKAMRQLMALNGGV